MSGGSVKSRPGASVRSISAAVKTIGNVPGNNAQQYLQQMRRAESVAVSTTVLGASATGSAAAPELQLRRLRGAQLSILSQRHLLRCESVRREYAATGHQRRLRRKASGPDEADRQDGWQYRSRRLRRLFRTRPTGTTVTTSIWLSISITSVKGSVAVTRMVTTDVLSTARYSNGKYAILGQVLNVILNLIQH